MRVAWRSLDGTVERVYDRAQRNVDLLDSLRRIGIDEISHRMGGSGRSLSVLARALRFNGSITPLWEGTSAGGDGWPESKVVRLHR